MECIYEAADRKPLTDQCIKVYHWEDPDLYEISIYRADWQSQMPCTKLAKVMLTRREAEKLAFSLQARIEDTVRKEAGL